jgi:nucleotide-binding universal stress UspA family protein
MVVITHVLCPIDFSEHARHALEHAAAIASWHHANVSVLHVHRPAVPTLAIVPGAVATSSEPIVATETEREELRRALNAFVEPTRSAGARIEAFVDEDPDVGRAIVSRAKSIGADLMVMGTHGRSGFERFLLGSVAENVLRSTATPVLTVPPHAGGARPAVLGYPFILCPVDFSSASDRALQYAASVAHETEGQLTILHVIEPRATTNRANDASDAEAHRAAQFGQSRSSIARLIAGLRESCKTAPLVLVGEPHKEILRVAVEQQADLIVMGVRGRGAVDVAVFGSTTQQVIRQAACPVLTLKALQH